jgi:mRNA-degrading endonuclease RelE of RelBE toxin-antitoxin system
MPRASLDDVHPYRVTFAATAWKQVGRISSGAFFELQATLERIAREMGSERPQDEDAHSELQTEVAGLRVTYQRDDQTQTVTLLDIQAVPSEPQ